MNLIIVESPTKAKTISQFIGKEYELESSYGHIRDLPKSKLGIDTENNFEPQYIIPSKARKRVTLLKKLASKADKIILATDEDREGEAIAWHLMQALGLNETKGIERIVFHEITAKAIKEALKTPRSIDKKLVDAQQARRVLDRLVGYLLSPFLWKKVFRGLSAGRVQSVALRLIAEREEEIKNFKPQEYWSIEALLRVRDDAEKSFGALLYKIQGKQLEKFSIPNKEEVEKIANNLKESKFFIQDIEKKLTKRNPLPPFTTSTLQQEASKRLHFSAKQTMRIAQGLYENGLITYMRTDSVNLSDESLQDARKWLEKNLGKDYLIDKFRVFKNKSRLAQEAHEAIRPTEANITPSNFGGINSKKLEANEARLYELIWRRFIASQMPEAVFHATTIDVLAEAESKNYYNLRASGSTLQFDGFLKIWQIKYSESELPSVKKEDELTLIDIKCEEHFTEPPPRFNEASLVKTLEEYGIGRPSTYAPIISVIQERNYVEKDEARRFRPTETGILVNSLLKEHFSDIVDVGFTAKIEQDFDEIAQGNKEWHGIIKSFYAPFAENLEKKYNEVEKVTPDLSKEKTNEVCDKCGKPMVVKISRFGKFLACSGFPECKNAKSLIQKEADGKNNFGPCAKCKQGAIVKKRTKRGRFFYGCSRYPDCDYATWKL